MKSGLVARLFITSILIVILCVFFFGCKSAPPPRNDALVIASCPELPPVAIVTPADSWRLHLDDAERYNTCRCAALAGTSKECPANPKPAE